jgi:glycine cleavage system H protein
MAAAPKSGEFGDGKLWFSRKLSMLTIGMTPTAIDQVGDVESIELPEEGDDFDKDDVVVTVEGTKGNIEVTTPAAGLVKEVNETLKEEPDVATEDPLEEGWLVKLEIQDSSDLEEYA